MNTTEPMQLRLEETVGAFVRARELFPQAGRVIVAVSGGADSMALLAFALRRAGDWGCTVEAAHVNHGLRGAAADADEAFVAAFCAEHDILLHRHSPAAAGIPVPDHPGEDWARRLRYDWFEQLAAARGAVIATAHTRTDQAETLLLRLARGSGLRGAAGIPVKRGCFARPLLCVERADTESYCCALGVPWVQDATNDGDDYARNRVRHIAVPALETVNPAAVRALSDFCERMAALDGYFAQKADTLLLQAAVPQGWRLEPLCAADTPVRQAALLTILRRVCDPSARRLELAEELLASGSGAVQLSPHARLRAGSGRIWLEYPADAERLAANLCMPLEPGEWALGDDFCVKIEILDAKFVPLGPDVYKKDLNSLADYAKIASSARLRTRQPGDRFAPRGRGVTKTLHRYFIEEKIPAPRRALWPLAADGSRVLWLWGAGFAEGTQPGPDTRQIIRITPIPRVEDVL